LREAGEQCKFSVMAVTEIKQQIDAMSDDDRFFAAAYLQHLANDRDEQRKSRLEERMSRMDAGQKISGEQLKDFHQRLEDQGL
jgi:hypothetical protein